MEENFPSGEHIVDHLLEGKKSLAGIQNLDEWVQASPGNKKDLGKYQKIWDGTADLSVLCKFDAQNAWTQVDSKLETKKVRVRQLKNLAFVVSGIAASLLIFVSLNFYTNLFSTSDATVSMSTTFGSRSQVILPDGSVVKLNAGSSLEYHYDRSHKIRQVNFSGEGFFEVAKSNQPFIIHTPEGLNVKVLGTKFNLSSYPEDNFTQISLVEGSVEMSHSGTASLIMKPGQIARFDNESINLDYTQGEVSQNLGWMQNKLYMDNMSLQEVCTRLHRWYDVQITLSDKEVGEKIHYTGVLKEQTLLDVLNALCQLSTIKYEIKGKEIMISGK